MSQVPPTVAPPVLHFACAQCGVTLSVPAGLAGVRGPCPGCGRTIEAPRPIHHRREAAVEPPPVGGGEACSRETERPDGIEPETAISRPDGPLGRWAFAALGVLLGAAAVFGSVWMWQLGRDLSTPATSAEPAGTAERADPTLEVLVEQRREAGRETAALLAAQQTVLRFLRSPTPTEARRWLDTPTAELDLVAKIIVRTHLEQGVSLEKKRRLPDGAGYLSTWRVGEAAQAGLLIQVNDCSGAPRIDWAALRSQLETAPAAVATSVGTTN